MKEMCGCVNGGGESMRDAKVRVLPVVVKPGKHEGHSTLETGRVR